MSEESARERAGGPEVGGSGREQELAELLREVRALREAVNELKSAHVAALPPGYAVLVKPQPVVQPEYAVAVRQALPDYAVLVRAQLPGEVVVNPVLREPPSYAVLVRPPIIDVDRPAEQ